jgi:putative oxidoreductase
MANFRDSSPSAGLGRWPNIGLWTLQVLLSATFFMAGGAKLFGVEATVKAFAALGLGQWFRYVTGILEVTAAVLLLVPWSSALGALLIVPIMLGAIAAHLFVFKNSPALPLVLLALDLVVLWVRRDQLRFLFGGTSRVGAV